MVIGNDPWCTYDDEKEAEAALDIIIHVNLYNHSREIKIRKLVIRWVKMIVYY